MTIRTKSIRRLLLLAAFAGASAAIVGAAFVYRRAARDAELANDRLTGMSAFQAGDLVHAMPPLTSYVTARPDDVDAIFALACTNYAIETPGRDNLFDARSRLQQILARQPDHLPAKLQLLKIYERTHLPRELLAMADDVLHAVSNNVDATRCRAVALTDLNRDADAVTAWEAYLALAPTDFQGQSQLLTVMKRAGRAPEELVAHAKANVDKAPDDPRFLLPLAAALREAGRDAEARTLLEQIAAKPQTDPNFVVELAAALDRARSFDVAEHLLARSSETMSSASLTTALIERMWQNGRHAQVIDATAKILADAKQRDPNVLASRALSLTALDRRPEAASLVSEIGSIKGNEEATAWSSALAIQFATTPIAPADQARGLRAALSHDPNNAILYVWLGRALRATGESEQASRCFREAAQRLPSWPTPCVELADAMLEAGRVGDAASAAKAAFLRAPSSMAVQLQVARVRFAQLNSKAAPADVAELLARVEELSNRLPSEGSLPAMHATLLVAQGNRDAAEKVVSDAVTHLPKGTDLQPLYSAGWRAGLSARESVFNRAIADNAVTPSFAMSRAADLASRTSSPAEAIAWMRSQASTHAADPAWALAETRVSQSLGDPAAGDAWRKLVATFPNELAIQSAALAEAASLLGDRAAQASTVERIKLLVGEDGSTYRIARAGWLAASNDDSEARQALTIAADLVRQQPGRTDLRLLLARVLVRLDSAATAIDHLRAAHDQAPADAGIALEYADTLRRAGRWAEAMTLLKTQATYDVNDANSRDILATALVEAGNYADAIDMLRRAAARAPLSTDEQLLLATSLENAGDLQGATAAFEAVTANDHSTPATLVAAAAFDRRQHQDTAAAALISQVDHLDVSADDRARAVAQYALQFGDVATARVRYNVELTKGTASVELMLDAIELEASQGDFSTAGLLATRGGSRFPDEPRLKLATLEVAARKAIASGQNASAAIDALVDAMAANPNSRREVAALRALQQSGSSDHPTAELATRLAALADANPTSIELAERAIAAALGSNQPQIAGALARRLLAGPSAHLDAVALGAQTLLAIHDLPTARRAAERWRIMAASDPVKADVTLAQIALADGAPARAVTTLTPYKDSIAWDHDAMLPSVMVEGLARSGHVADAFDLMEPALATSAAARSAWMRVTALTARTNGDATVARLGRLETATPADATAEQVQLAGAYFDVSQSFPEPRAIERGIALLAPLEASGRLTGNARALLGELQRTSGSKPVAIATLRDALRAEPDNAMVKNSLAYALLGTPGSEDEACKLATEATAADPSRAAFQDTLARTYLGTHQSAKAEAAFREAIRLDDASLDAWVGLARLQSQLGKTADAQVSMKHVDAVLAKSETGDAPLYLREELRTVRETVASVTP